MAPIFFRLVSLLLIPVLWLAFTAPRVCAQTTGDGDAAETVPSPVVASDDDEDDDEQTETILVGLLVVVVALLVILGIKSDRSWHSKTKAQAKPAALAAEERWDVEYQPAVLSDTVDFQLTEDRLDAGVGVRF